MTNRARSEAERVCHPHTPAERSDERDSKELRGSTLAAASLVLVLLASPSARAQTGHAVFFEGPVRVARGEVVDSLVVLEGPTRIDGIVARDLVAVGGDVNVRGTVGGDLVALGGVVRLGSQAQVGGDLVTMEPPVLAEGAHVAGAVRRMDQRAPIRFGDGISSYLLGWLAMTVSAFMLALLLGWLVPRRASDALYETARAEPGKALGVGLLAAITLPVVAIASIITVVGIPFGLALLLGMVALAFAGFVASGWVIGRGMAERWERVRRWHALGWLALGVGILCAISLVPVIGGIVWIVASLMGVGAGTLAGYYARRGRRPAERAPEPPRPPMPTKQPPPEPFHAEQPASA